MEGRIRDGSSAVLRGTVTVNEEKMCKFFSRGRSVPEWVQRIVRSGGGKVRILRVSWTFLSEERRGKGEERKGKRAERGSKPPPTTLVRASG